MEFSFFIYLYLRACVKSLNIYFNSEYSACTRPIRKQASVESLTKQAAIKKIIFHTKIRLYFSNF
jgi:hypothetical protein